MPEQEALILSIFIRIDPDDAGTFGDEVRRLITEAAFTVEAKVDAMTIQGASSFRDPGEPT